MDLERSTSTAPRRAGLSLPARVAIGAVAVFGAITIVQWVIGALLGIVKFVLVVVVVIAVAVWVVGAKGSR